MYNPFTGQAFKVKQLIPWGVAAVILIWFVFIKPARTPPPASDTEVYKITQRVNDSIRKIDNLIIRTSDSVRQKVIDSLLDQIKGKDVRLQQLKKNRENNLNRYNDLDARELERQLSEEYNKRSGAR